jgi:hypothetical protein
MVNYTDEQVAEVMKAQGIERIPAIHLIKRMKGDVAKAVAYVKDAPAPKAEHKHQKAKPAAKAKTAKQPKKAKYDATLVIKMWDGGMRPSEIRESDKPGIKGISSPFVSRILFGTTYENGQTPEQKARHKEELRRRKERHDAKDKGGKN